MLQPWTMRFAHNAVNKHLFQAAIMGVGEVLELCAALALGLAAWTLSAVLYLLSSLRDAVFGSSQQQGKQTDWCRRL